MMHAFLFAVCLSATVAGKPWFVVNEDNDHFFKCDSSLMTERGLSDYIDYICRGKVTHVFFCVNGQRTSYGSKTWEPIWAGLDEQARPDTATRPDGTHDRWAVNCKKLFDAGIDPYAVWIQRCREKGVRPWVSMRMNDIHGSENPKYFRNTAWYKAHPEFRLDPTGANGILQQLDYAHKEVCDYTMAQVKEIAARWPADGVELDWMRFGLVFKPNEERANAPLLDAFVREASAAIRATGKQVAVRVPYDHEVCEEFGFNVIRWAKEGWVDVVIPAPFIRAATDLPVGKWRKALAGAKVRLVPDLGCEVPCADRTRVPAAYRGIAASFLGQGADGAYLYNLPYKSNAAYSSDSRGKAWCWDLDVAAELYANGLAPEDVRGLPVDCPVSVHDWPPAAVGLDRLKAAGVTDGEITAIEHGEKGLRVAFVLRPTPRSFIRCELGLADPEKWDGRFWGLGNGGWAGHVSCTRDGVSAYACTDLGTSQYQDRTATDVPREVLTDYAWRATHLMTVEAKRLVTAYYGRKPDRCYFRGASCGGRQGIVEADRFPEDYDGILSEVPGFTEHSRASHAWVRDRLKDKYRKWFTQEEIAAVREAELSYFEKTDPWWAHGRFILDPYPTKEKLDGCWAEIVRRVPALADREEMWRKLFNPVTVNGKPYAPGRLIGIEFDSAWTFLLPKYSGKKRAILNTEDDLARFAAEPDIRIGHDFSAFRARGGKLIMYGGLEDLSCPEPEMREFYEAVLKEMGGIGEVSKFFAYYAVPGRSHGAKGEPFGPGQVGWPTQKERNDKLVDWVEKGVRPGALNFIWAHETEKTLSITPYPESKLTYSDAGVPETAKWQKAINETSAKGGGTVVIPKGRHLVGQLELRNGVELRLERDAVLEGAVGLKHYRTFALPCSEGVWSAIIVGNGVTNVAITGEGTVFGNGAAWPLPTAEDFKRGAQEGLRARGIFFNESKDIRLEGFTLKDAACWGIVLKNCDGVTARRVKVDNHGNFNNDGFDIEAKNVLIEDCDADTGDDSFCLKSNDPNFTMENVVIRNCRARGHCTGFKIGTATHGVVRNVRFENCTSDVALRSVQYPLHLPDGTPFYYHLSNAFTPRYPNGFNLSAVALECVDGGCVENVTVDGLEIVDGARAPIFVRADLRKSRGEDGIDTPPNKLNVMRNITIANVRGKSMGPVASSITGVKGFRIKNVTLRNIDLVQPGAGEERSRRAMMTSVPYLEGLYPSADIFYPHLFPAYGLYVDRAEVKMENVNFRLEEGTVDLRPAIVVANSNDAKDEARFAQSKPDYLVYSPRQRNGDAADPKVRGDSYNDHFQVIWDEKRRLYYAFWTQGTGEGKDDMHVVFSKSADRGATWTYPVVLAGSEFAADPKPRAVWQQPMLSKSERLYCLWNQQVTDDRLHHGEMRGIFSDDAGVTWSAPQKVEMKAQLRDKPGKPPSWCNWQRPLRLGKDGRFFVGCTRRGTDPQEGHTSTKIEFWEFENIDEDPEPKDIRIGYYATGKDSLAVEIGNINRYLAEEAGIVKLPDGRLFALVRTRARHPFWSQSRDGGRTWSALKPLVGPDGKPFLHPCSPCPIYDWKGCEAASGTYFAFIHNTYDDTIEPLGKQKRGPLYLIAGTFDPNGEQPIRFSAPKLFSPVTNGNSYYASYTVADGEGVLWFAHQKHWLLGRRIGPEWFK